MQQIWPRDRLHLRESDQAVYQLLLRRRPCGQHTTCSLTLRTRRTQCTVHRLPARKLLSELAKQANLVDGFRTQAVGERLQLLRNQTPRTVDLSSELWHTPRPSLSSARRERACSGLQLPHQSLVNALLLALKNLLRTHLSGRVE